MAPGPNSIPPGLGQKECPDLSSREGVGEPHMVVDWFDRKGDARLEASGSGAARPSDCRLWTH